VTASAAARAHDGHALSIEKDDFMKMTAHSLATCLWFDTQAEEAVNFYVSIFENSRVGGSVAMT
jgi:hypothetical protein